VKKRPAGGATAIRIDADARLQVIVDASEPFVRAQPVEVHKGDVLSYRRQGSTLRARINNGKPLLFKRLPRRKIAHA
jgi:hypothetical protein